MRAAWPTLMILGLGASSWARPAGACEPGEARIRATVPADGAGGVPTDARLGVWWENYAEDLAFEAVLVDGERVEGSTETLVHEESAGAWTGLTLFTPDEPFPAGARVKAYLSPAVEGQDSRSFSFLVGDQLTTEAIAAPSLLSLKVRELPEAPDAPCGEARRKLTGELGPAAEATELSWLFLHRTTPEGTLDDWFTVLGTAADAPLSFDLSTTDLDRDLDVECYTVVQVDAAGNRVSSAEARCATVLEGRTPPEEDAKGCSAGSVALGLGWLWAAPLLLRRRR